MKERNPTKRMVGREALPANKSFKREGIRLKAKEYSFLKTVRTNIYRLIP